MNDNIPSRKLTEHVIPDDIEIMCVEINLKKQKWVLLGIYRPPKMNEKYFLDHLSRVIDVYSRKYDKIVIMGDFNLEPIDESNLYVTPIICIILSKRKHVLRVHQNVMI